MDKNVKKIVLIILVICLFTSWAYAIKISGGNTGDVLNISGYGGVQIYKKTATVEAGNFTFVDGNNFIFVDTNNFTF